MRRVLPRFARSHRPAFVIAGLAVIAAGCGNPQVKDAPPPPPPPKKQAPAAPDAFRDHSGPHAAAGEVFQLKDTPIAVDGVRVVVSLIKASWTKRELDDGRVIREGSAEIEVRKGEERTSRILDQDESVVLFGVRVTVTGAGEDYDKSRLDYIPWVELKVEAAQ